MQLNPGMDVVELALLELLRVNRVYLAISLTEREWPESVTEVAQRVEDELLRRPINWESLREACIAANMRRGYTIQGFSATAYGAQQGIINPDRSNLRDNIQRMEDGMAMAQATVMDSSTSANLRERQTINEIRFLVAQYIRHEHLREGETA